jgi:Regulator of ribonuclease activity B
MVPRMSELPKWYESTLATQLRMTPATWHSLQEHGVDEETSLRLDFLYFASGEADAESLERFLFDETDYEIERKPPNDDSGWIVTGQTQQTTVSFEVLAEWVAWMVAAGAQYGCKFDGWGASIPKTA